jgi:hemolysin III
LSAYLKDPVSGFLHVAGFVLALIGAGFLLGRAHGTESIAIVAVYGVCLVMLYAASAIYHLMPAGERLTRALRLLDHIAIFLLVAGTSTPVIYRALSGSARVWMLAMIWGLALIGTIVKITWSSAPRAVYTAMYVVMGWSVIGVLRALPIACSAYVVAGALVYTAGALIYAFRWFPRAWHVSVLLGSALHFLAIAQLS